MRAAAMLAAMLVVACGGRPGDTAPRLAESVGTAEHFGPGIVALGDAGDRILVDVRVNAFWSLVRLDSSGAAVGASAMTSPHPPAMTWLEIPSAGRGITRATRTAVNPVCDRGDRSARQQCTRNPRVIETGPTLLEAGEVVILIVTIDPLTPAMLEDRVAGIGPGTPRMRIPAIIMDGRTDVWAAYLARR